MDVVVTRGLADLDSPRRSHRSTQHFGTVQPSLPFPPHSSMGFCHGTNAVQRAEALPGLSSGITEILLSTSTAQLSATECFHITCVLKN